MKYYTGVGSRTPPDYAIYLARMIGHEMYTAGYTLRSGAADGMDAAFEFGHDKGRDESLGADLKEIWLPHKKFNKHPSPLLPCDQAFSIAEKFHPAWHACNKFARQAHARNVHQVLGANLNTPSSAVFAWTYNGELLGGTATALKVAQSAGIPIFNLGDVSRTMAELVEFIERFTGTQ